MLKWGGQGAGGGVGRVWGGTGGLRYTGNEEKKTHLRACLCEEGFL